EPDHLAVTTVVDPSPVAGATADALLLHDVVPGGTGYLAELADPDEVWSMLRAAWEHLSSCPCRNDERLACEQCLLPYAGPRQAPRVSRAAAVRYLTTILWGGARPPEGADAPEPPTANPWVVTTDEPAAVDPETELEQLFRKVLRERLTRIGATITEKPGASGNAWSITLPGGAAWRLVPQVYAHGARPDFTLYADRQGVPPTAIFTDGWRFHASPSVNRLADDARKRQVLRDAGFQVLAFTWDDLQPAGEGSVVDVPWLRPEAPGAVLAAAKDQLAPAMVGLVSAPPLDLLVAWIQSPELERRTQLARWLALLIAPALSEGSMVSLEIPMGQFALRGLDNGFQAGTGTVFGGVGRHDTLGFGVRDIGMGVYEVGIVLDDSPEALG